MPLVLPFLIHAVGPKGPRQGIGSPSQEIGPPSQEVGLQEAQRDCADGRREQACSHRPGQCFDDDADSVSRRTSLCPDHGPRHFPLPRPRPRLMSLALCSGHAHGRTGRRHCPYLVHWFQGGHVPRASSTPNEQRLGAECVATTDVPRRRHDWQGPLGGCDAAGDECRRVGALCSIRLPTLIGFPRLRQVERLQRAPTRARHLRRRRRCRTPWASRCTTSLPAPPSFRARPAACTPS